MSWIKTIRALNERTQPIEKLRQLQKFRTSQNQSPLEWSIFRACHGKFAATLGIKHGTKKTGPFDMPAIDFSHLTLEQRLDLIGELCESIDRDGVRVTEAQAAELDRRIAMLDAAPEQGHDAFATLAEFRARYP
jgi:putative addiction module component (TIGR02574 family)